MLKKTDGSTCNSVKENADTFLHHFKTLYQRAPAYDPSVVDILTKYPTIHDAAKPSTNEEIKAAINKLNDTAPGPSGKV